MIESVNPLIVESLLCLWLTAGCSTFIYIICVLNNQDLVTHASVGPVIYWVRLGMSLYCSLFGWPLLLALFKFKRTRAYRQTCTKWLNQKGLHLGHYPHISGKTEA